MDHYQISFGIHTGNMRDMYGNVVFQNLDFHPEFCNFKQYSVTLHIQMKGNLPLRCLSKSINSLAHDF